MSSTFSDSAIILSFPLLSLSQRRIFKFAFAPSGVSLVLNLYPITTFLIEALAGIFGFRSISTPPSTTLHASLAYQLLVAAFVATVTEFQSIYGESILILILPFFIGSLTSSILNEVSICGKSEFQDGELAVYSPICELIIPFASAIP